MPGPSGWRQSETVDMSLRRTIKHMIPVSILNRTLLAFPDLYRLPFIQFESNIWENGGVDDICKLLEISANCSGNVIECGASRCGTSILMALHLRRIGAHKTVYALDSYQGFPPDEAARERAQGLTDVAPGDHTSTDLGYVSEKIRRLGCENSVIPVKGFFTTTLPSIASQGNFALAFIDCDLKESTSYCSRTVWPRLASGGVLAFDDYLGPLHCGVKVAVDEFVSSNESDIKSHGMLRRLYYVRKR